MISAKVNDKAQFQISIDENTVIINEKESLLDMIVTGKDRQHLLLNNRSFAIELIAADPETKTYTLLVNGKKQVVTLQDEMDQLLNRLGLADTAGKKINEIKAPMPGLVLKVLVEPGQAIKKGDSLLVLEAMKMENVIKSPGDGVVKAIQVKPQDKVDKNFVLINLE